MMQKNMEKILQMTDEERIYYNEYRRLGRKGEYNKITDKHRAAKRIRNKVDRARHPEIARAHQRVYNEKTRKEAKEAREFIQEQTGIQILSYETVDNQKRRIRTIHAVAAIYTKKTGNSITGEELRAMMEQGKKNGKDASNLNRLGMHGRGGEPSDEKDREYTDPV